MIAFRISSCSASNCAISATISGVCSATAFDLCCNQCHNEPPFCVFLFVPFYYSAIFLNFQFLFRQPFCAFALCVYSYQKTKTEQNGTYNGTTPERDCMVKFSILSFCFTLFGSMSMFRGQNFTFTTAGLIIFNQMTIYFQLFPFWKMSGFVVLCIFCT